MYLLLSNHDVWYYFNVNIEFPYKSTKNKFKSLQNSIFFNTMNHLQHNPSKDEYVIDLNDMHVI